MPDPARIAADAVAQVPDVPSGPSPIGAIVSLIVLLVVLLVLGYVALGLWRRLADSVRYDERNRE